MNRSVANRVKKATTANSATTTYIGENDENQPTFERGELRAVVNNKGLLVIWGFYARYFHLVLDGQN